MASMPKHFQTFMKDMKDMKDKYITFTIGKHLASGLNNFYRESCEKFLHILHILHYHASEGQFLFFKF